MSFSGKLVRLANYLMTAAFLFSVAVQYNDPDPVRWMAIYGSAAVACVLSLGGRLPWFLAALIGFIALVWAGLWAPGIVGKASFRDMFQSFEMANTLIEEEREMFGLFIVAVWMALLAVLSHRTRSQPSPT